MCGYVSTGLRNAVIKANQDIAARKQRALGNVFAVVAQQKNGKVSKPYFSNLSAEAAAAKAADLNKLNNTTKFFVTEA